MDSFSKGKNLSVNMYVVFILWTQLNIKTHLQEEIDFKYRYKVEKQ